MWNKRGTKSNNNSVGNFQERRKGGAGGQALLLSFSKRGKEGKSALFIEKICFFNNVQFDIIKTRNLTLKLNNHCNLH